MSLRGVHNEIHNVQKPSEALLSQVFQVVGKGNQRAKGWQWVHMLIDTDHKGTSQTLHAK